MSPTLLVLATVLGAAVASMPVFAVAHRARRDPDADSKGSSFLMGLGDFLVHWLMWAISPLERGLLRLGASPDHMNAAGLLFGLTCAVLRYRYRAFAILRLLESEVLTTESQIARKHHLLAAHSAVVRALACFPWQFRVRL